MVRKRIYVNGCPACMTVEEAIALTAKGGVVTDYFRARDGFGKPPVIVEEILCWWCRTMHSPAEVETCMALPRKVAPANGSESSLSNALDAGPLKTSPELWAFLTSTSFPDGTKRRTGRLSITFESGLLGLLLTDEETGQYAFLNGRNLNDLLAEAELRLADGSLSFRASRFQRRK